MGRLHRRRRHVRRAGVTGHLPAQERLAGDGGAAPVHTTLLQIAYGSDRWSGNVDIRRDGGYRLRRDIGRNGPDDVVASPFTTIGLDLSYRLTRVFSSGGEDGETRRGGGLRLQLSVKNLLASSGRARLGDGRPSPGYRAPTEDFAGRTVQLALTTRF